MRLLAAAHYNTLAGGKGSRTGSGRSLASMALRVRRRGENGSVDLNDAVKRLCESGGFVVRVGQGACPRYRGAVARGLRRQIPTGSVPREATTGLHARKGFPHAARSSLVAIVAILFLKF
jgi:hypothetical protein